MKTKKLFGILSLLIIIGVTSCNSDTPQDNVENIKMKVSSEIGTYQPWGSDTVQPPKEKGHHPQSKPAACGRNCVSRIEARGSLYKAHRGRNSQEGGNR